MDDVSFEPLKSSSSDDFEKFFQIYHQSIDPREQKTKNEIQKLVERSDYRILLLKKSKKVIGFSIVYLSQAYKIGLLEYMAIEESMRSLGLGGSLLQKTFQGMKADGDYRFGVIEVDTPSAENNREDIKRRRVEFYRRQGCLVIDELKYILPLPGVGEPPKMNLMIYPLDQHDVISRKMLWNWLQEIYNKVYSCSPQDGRISQMMNVVSDPIRIRKI